MKNFKKIAEQVLAGKIKGFFILRNGTAIHSSHLYRKLDRTYPYELNASTYTEDGNVYLHLNSERDVIKFKKKEEVMEEKRKIEINIPEDKIAIIEETSEKITITWKKKELTYEDIIDRQTKTKTHISVFSYNMLTTDSKIHAFYKKVEVLRKLINIRNYFGKPKYFRDGVVIKCINSYCGVETGQFYFDKPDLDSLHEVVFAEKEHAQAAIKILGDEVKYLFEPW